MINYAKDYVTPKKLLYFFSISLIFLLSCASQVDRKRELMGESIKAYIGTPYQWGGISKRGLDCSGFTQEVYKRAGVALPRTVEEQFKKGSGVDKDELEYGDLVFFQAKLGESFDCCLFPCILFPMKPSGSTKTTHVGIYVGDGKFAHSSTSRGVVIDNFNTPYWEERFVGARRLLD